MVLVDGLELLDHDPALFADGFEHPNAAGNRQVATRLNAVMRVPGLRPSSVGRRRKKRTRLLPEPVLDENNNTMMLPLEELMLG